MAITKVTSGLISADASSIDLNIDAGTLYLDVSENRVGIGTTSPKTTLNVAANNSGQGPILTLENTDTAITTNDVVGQIDFYSNDGSTGGTGQKATIQAVAENSSGTGVGLTFGTSPFPNTTATERIRIDASGNVGIGTSSPSELLHLSSAEPVLRFTDSDDGNYHHIFSSSNDFYISADRNDSGSGNLIFRNGATSERMRIGSDGKVYFGNQDNAASSGYIDKQTSGDYEFKIHASTSTGTNRAITFHNRSNTEAMRIDSSGRLLLGTTSFSTANNGILGHNDGRFYATSTSQAPLNLNRKTSDGDIAIFSKDGTTVGSIGTYSSDRLFIGAGDTNITFKPSDDIFYPSTATGAARDNAIGLGDSGARFKDLYLSGTANVGSYSVNSSTGIELKGSSGQINHDVFTDNSATTTIMINSRVASGANACLQYRTNNVIEGNILGSSTGLAISNVSDYRKKQNIRNLTGSLDIIKSLQPRVYNYKEGFAKDTTKDYVGFIAHELSEYIPDSVIGTKDEVYTQNDIDNGVTDAVIGEPKYQSVLYSSNEILTRLVQSIQEQQTIIDDLKTRIETLENA